MSDQLHSCMASFEGIWEIDREGSGGYNKWDQLYIYCGPSDDLYLYDVYNFHGDQADGFRITNNESLSFAKHTISIRSPEEMKEIIERGGR